VDLYDLLVLSLRTLAKNKMRSGLTVLGVVIGIAAVTTMVSIGEGAGRRVRNEFQNLGPNVIVVFPAGRRTAGVHQGKVTTLTAEDAAAVAAECPAVLAVTPQVMAGGQVISAGQNWQPQHVLGVGPDYPLVRNCTVAAGGFFGDREVDAAAKVCVLGLTVVARVFSDTDPIGKEMRVKNIPFTVIGVLARKGANLVGDDEDDVVLMPYTTVRKRLQGAAFADVDLLIVSARTEEQEPQAEQQIRGLLAARHHIPPEEPPDVEVRSVAQVAAVLYAITGTLTALLAAIAAISLVVGGVGIMNIMLVSVTERTREIGLRMALGARPRDILRQFLVEAVVLSSVGGAIGVALGVGMSAGATALINALLPGLKWPQVLSMPAAIVALLFAAAVGIFFGYYPARRASRLDPIEALRYD
jgi:putative ABC transport system permease protein